MEKFRIAIKVNTTEGPNEALGATFDIEAGNLVEVYRVLHATIRDMRATAVELVHHEDPEA